VCEKGKVKVAKVIGYEIKHSLEIHECTQHGRWGPNTYAIAYNDECPACGHRSSCPSTPHDAEELGDVLGETHTHEIHWCKIGCGVEVEWGGVCERCGHKAAKKAIKHAEVPKPCDCLMEECGSIICGKEEAVAVTGVENKQKRVWGVGDTALGKSQAHECASGWRITEAVRTQYGFPRESLNGRGYWLTLGATCPHCGHEARGKENPDSSGNTYQVKIDAEHPRGISAALWVDGKERLHTGKLQDEIANLKKVEKGLRTEIESLLEDRKALREKLDDDETWKSSAEYWKKCWGEENKRYTDKASVAAVKVSELVKKISELEKKKLRVQEACEKLDVEVFDLKCRLERAAVAIDDWKRLTEAWATKHGKLWQVIRLMGGNEQHPS